MNRRAFCTHACQAVSMTTMAGLLDGCGGSPMSPSAVPPLASISGTVVNGVVTVNIDAASPLASIGGAALVQGSLLVTRTAQNTFSALTAVCTHESCIINGFSGQKYVCPCHGSEYSTSGSVLKGPASRALRAFDAQFAQNVLTIRT